MFSFDQTRTLIRAQAVLCEGPSSQQGSYCHAALIDRAFIRLCREIDADKVDRQAVNKYYRLVVEILEAFV